MSVFVVFFSLNDNCLFCQFYPQLCCLRNCHTFNFIEFQQ